MEINSDLKSFNEFYRRMQNDLIISLGIPASEFNDTNHISEQQKENNSMEEKTETSPLVDLAAKMIERLEGTTDTTTLTVDQLVALVDEVSSGRRKEMVDEAQAINHKADARIEELEVIEGKSMPEAVKKNIRRMTNNDHLIAKRAARMGITSEEYQIKFPKEGSKNVQI